MRQFRHAQTADLPQIMGIVAQAQAYLAAQGIDQWQDGYPDEATMREDIARQNAYVLAEDDRVCGIASIIFDGEPTYDRIHDGAWTTAEPYAAIHRIAVDATMRGKGIADAVMQGAEEVVARRGLTGIRIDTHRQNVVMQRMLQRNGYALCGVIYLTEGKEAGAERVALEKTLKL